MGAAAERLGALREAVARIEDRAVEGRRAERIVLGVKPLDDALGGGVRRGALHAVAGGSVGAAAAATGFVVALAALAASDGRGVLWIRQDLSGLESGEPWPPGLGEIGLDPARLVIFRAPDAGSAFEAAETALAASALGAVVIEPFGQIARFGRTQGRRLALAAGRAGVTVFLLSVGAQPPRTPAGLSAAETRWLAEPLVSAAQEEAWGRPRATLELVRNRLGALGRWPLEWGCDDGLFRLAEPDFGDALGRLDGAPDPCDRAAGAEDRSGEAEGRLVAFRRAG